jgi:hypothetical protein
LDFVRATSGVAGFPRDRWDRVDQGQELGDIMAIRRDDRSGQRDTSGISDHMVFAPGLAPIYRIGASLRPSSDGAYRGTVDDGPGEIDPVGTTQLGQQHVVDLVPNSGRLPVAPSPPARHSATTSHLLGQVFPGNAGFEDEDDPGQGLAIIELCWSDSVN